MKRDMELVRKLLFFFDEKPGPELVRVPIVDGFPDEMTIKYHLVLMYEAGLLSCEPLKSTTSDRVYEVIPFDLTWAGHEFLDKIRSESVWTRVRGVIAEKGGSLAFDIINGLASKFALDLATQGAS